MKQAEKVTITCYGRSVTLRKSKVPKARLLSVPLKRTGALGEAKLPPLEAGNVRFVGMDAAASFWGYRDEWPGKEMEASVIRAREILAAGVTQMAIEKAKPCN